MPIGIWCCTLSLRQVALARLLVHLGIRELRSASSTGCELSPFTAKSTFSWTKTCRAMVHGDLGFIGNALSGSTFELGCA